MKSFSHFKEDIEQKRQDAAQATTDKMNFQRKMQFMRQKSKADSEERQKEREEDKKELKQEIKNEIMTDLGY